jgi:hypothetical protein
LAESLTFTPSVPSKNATDEKMSRPELPRWSQQLRDVLLTAPFIALFLVQLAHHEMWRDELWSFGIAVASPTLSSVFWHIRFEGHPWLWYVLLWVLSRLTTSPVGMKVLQAVIGTAIYLVIGVGSPFSRIEKTLLFLCYYISFEYTVMSRMYGVVLLLMLVYIRQRALHPERVLRGALLLGLMASATMMGVILSGALFIEYYFSVLTARNIASRPGRQQLAWGAALYLGLTSFSLWSLRPSPDISWQAMGHPFASAADPKHFFSAAMRYIVLPYFPTLQPGSFWNAFPAHPEHRLVYLAIFLPLILGAYYVLFRRHCNLLLLVGLTIVVLVAFGHLIYLGSTRHYGFTFLAFLAAIWLLRSQSPRLPTIAFVLLGLTAVSGIYAGVQAWQRPFSNAGPTARWLVANHLDKAPIVGIDAVAVSIAILLDRYVYMLDCGCSDRYMLFSKRIDSFRRSQIPDRLVIAMAELHVSSFVYIRAVAPSTEDESAIRSKGLTVKRLGSFAGAQVADENFQVYQVSEADKPPIALSEGWK